jgi:hypothetical protein
MGTTTKGLPYPSQSDDPNVPGDIQALATAVDTELNDYPTEVEAAATYATLALTYSRSVIDGRTPSAAFTGTARIHLGSAVVNPGPGGLAAVTHGAAFTPSRVIAVVSDADTALISAGGLFCNVASDTLGGTTFSVRVFKNNGSAHEQNCYIWYACFTA